MSTQTAPSQIRPMNVQVKKGSAAENYYRSQAGLPGGKAMLPAERLRPESIRLPRMILCSAEAKRFLI